MQDKKLKDTGSKTVKLKRKVNLRLKNKKFRKLTESEVCLLKSIWKWRVLNYEAAKRLCFNKASYWSFYEKVKRLIAEGYLIERDGAALSVTVLQLSKKGFEYLKYDLGFLTQDRFAAQSVSHDYWASAFQLGEFILQPSDNVEFFTEQEHQCTDDSLLPDWVQKSREHIPDGFTKIKNAIGEFVFAFEVELNLKPAIRYVKAGYYFDGIGSQAEIVFWLCDGKKLMENICKHLNAAKIKRTDIHHFVLLDDFKKLGWNAITKSGREQGKTVRNIYLQRFTQDPPNVAQSSTQCNVAEIFLSKRKSPWVSKT